MKRKVVIALVTGLMVASLVGCGAEETNQSPESSVVENESETDDSGKSKEPEETGGEEETASDGIGAEDENIVLYAEKGKQDYAPLNGDKYELHEGTVTATEDILLYNEKGYNVGYIKNGATISITEYGSGWTRFKNPINGTDYDYLYVLRDYVTDEEVFRVTASDIQQKIIDDINKKELTLLDAPTDDMEMYECRVDSVYRDEIGYLFSYGNTFHSNDLNIGDYMTYYVECEEDTDGWIICRIYYKDAYDPYQN